MIDDKPIDYKLEHNKVINELVKLRQKYDELKEDRDYIKSLLDVEFEKRIKLQKENEELKQRVNNKIKELEKKRKSAIGGTWYSGKLIAQIEILEELKEELE